MPDDAWLPAGTRLRIPRSEVSYRATRAGGPGGQHVNTSSTRIELWWNARESRAPTEVQRALISERLGHRLDQEGWLRLVEAGSRSQLRNREAVTERFQTLLEQAVRPRKARKATRVSKAAKARRLESKRQRGEIKQLRKPVRGDE
jgi:ribosome-associated protein